MDPLFFLVYSVLLGGFSAWATVKLGFHLLFKKREAISRELLEKVDIQGEMHHLADRKLDGLVQKFKAKVPMAAMFLTGELEKTLKNTAKEELLALAPEIKENFAKKPLDISPLLRLARKVAWQALLFGALIGLVCGLFFIFK